jgi:hypothetical protein
MFNQWDSYPSGLGASIVRQIQAAIRMELLKQWKRKLHRLKIINEYKSEEIIPTKEDRKALRLYAKRKEEWLVMNEWYRLTYYCQGDLFGVIRSGILLNAINEDGTIESTIVKVDAEYSYIINYDTNRFDFYVGDELRSYKFDKLPEFTEESDEKYR